MAFCYFKLCLLATRHGDDSSQRRQLYLLPLLVTKKKNKGNRLNWGAILFVVPPQVSRQKFQVNTAQLKKIRQQLLSFSPLSFS